MIPDPKTKTDPGPRLLPNNRIDPDPDPQRDPRSIADSDPWQEKVGVDPDPDPYQDQRSDTYPDPEQRVRWKIKSVNHKATPAAEQCQSFAVYS